MKNKWIGILVITGGLLLLPVSGARAVDLYGFASYWDKGDIEGKAGLGFGARMPLVSEHLLLDGRIAFYGDSTFDGSDELSMVPVDLGLQVPILPGATLNPYVMGGFSYIYADADRSDVDSSFGGYLGGGVEWAPFSVVHLFGELVFRIQDLDGGRGSDIDVSGATGNIGLKVSF